MGKRHKHDWYINDISNTKDGTGPAEEICDTCGKTRKITIEKYKG